MRSIYLSLLVLAVIISSCSEKKLIDLSESSSFKKVDSIKFNHEFAESTREFFELDGKKYFSFANYKTEKVITLYNENGDFVKNFDLSFLQSFPNGIMAYEIADLNTLLVIPYKKRQIFVLDDKGKLKDIIDFESQFLSFKQGSLSRELDPSFLLPNRKTAIFNFVNYPNLGALEDKSRENLVAVNKHYTSQPKLMVIEDVFAKPLEVKALLPDVFDDQMADDEMFWKTFHFCYSNDKLLTYFEYSNKVKVYNDKFEFESMGELSSDFAEIGSKAPTVDNYNNLAQTFKEGAEEKLFVRSVYNDPKTGNYLITLIKYFEFDKTLEYPQLLVYDKDWNKLEEIRTEEYNQLKARQVGDRYYFKRENSNVYDIFEFVKD